MVINLFNSGKMKKATIVLIYILIPGIYIIQAQDKAGGIRFGYNSAALYENGSKLSGTENLESFYVGIFRDNQIIPFLCLGTGLEYCQNGSKVDTGNKLILHYISVPLNLKVRIGSVFGRAGIAPAIKVSEKAIIGGKSTTPEEKSRVFDTPVFLGAGFSILFLSVEARYHWGLAEIRDGIRNRYLQLGAAISF